LANECELSLNGFLFVLFFSLSVSEELSSLMVHCCALSTRHVPVVLLHVCQLTCTALDCLYIHDKNWCICLFIVSHSTLWPGCCHAKLW